MGTSTPPSTGSNGPRSAGIAVDDTTTEAGTTDGSRPVDTPAGATATTVADRPTARQAVADRPTWRDHALVGIALAPLLVSAAALVAGADDYHPTGDLATSELAVRDIGREPVLTGLYSRGTWSHPGPLLWYLLWPVYRLTGSTGLGLELGASAINGVAVAGIAYVARRRGGTPLLVCALLGCAVLVRSLGAGFTASYWNLHITTLPFALLVLLVWAMACGERWALPAAAAVATLLAQTHVGFVPVALGLLVWGVVAGLLPAFVAARRGDARAGVWASLRAAAEPLARPAVATAGLLALLWLPPVVDALANSPSNAQRLGGWFREGSDETHTLAEGWRIVSAQYGVTAEWLVGKAAPHDAFYQSPYYTSAPVPLLLVAFAAAVVALWRWSPRSGRPLVLTLTAASAISVVALARTVGPLFDYRLRWTWVTPTLAMVAVVWAGWQAAERWRPAFARRVVLPGLVVALVAVTGIDAVAAARADRLEREDSDIMGTLIPGVLDELEELDVGPDDEVLVSDFVASVWYANGLLVELDRRGYEVGVPEGRRWQLGEQWVTEDDPDVWLVVASDQAALEMLKDPDSEVVATWSSVPLDDDGIARLDDLYARTEDLGEQLQRWEIDIATFVERARKLGEEVPASGALGMRLVVVTRADPP
jgi:hypothetical protein